MRRPKDLWDYLPFEVELSDADPSGAVVRNFIRERINMVGDLDQWKINYGTNETAQVFAEASGSLKHRRISRRYREELKSCYQKWFIEVVNKKRSGD